MEPKFNTSFIPKKSLQADTSSSGSSRNKYVSRRTVHGPGFFLTLLFFIATIIGSVAVFGYTTIVISSIDDKKAALEEKKKAFKTEEIEALIHTELRIANARKLVFEHVAISQLFNKLEEITLKHIQYMGLTYTAKKEDSPNILSITGVSRNFQDVALQTKAYRSDEYLHTPIVQELELLEEIETVDFSVNSTVDERLISFSSAVREKRLGSSSVVPTVPSVEVTPEEGEAEPE